MSVFWEVFSCTGDGVRYCFTWSFCCNTDVIDVVDVLKHGSDGASRFGGFASRAVTFANGATFLVVTLEHVHLGVHVWKARLRLPCECTLNTWNDYYDWIDMEKTIHLTCVYSCTCVLHHECVVFLLHSKNLLVDKAPSYSVLCIVLFWSTYRW